jgi:hypothetical protein
MSKYHGKNIDVFIDGYDMSGFANSLTVDQTGDPVEVSAFSSASKEYVVGLYDSKVSLSGFYDDSGTIGVHDVLTARIGSAVNFMALVSNNVGGYSFAGSAELVKMYNVGAAINGAVTFKTELDNYGTEGVDSCITLAGRGTIAGSGLAAAVLITATAGGRVYMQNFGSYGVPASVAPGCRGTVYVIGGYDAAFTPAGTTVLAAGTFGTAPSAIGFPVGSATYMRVWSPAYLNGTFLPQVAVTVDAN